MASGPITSWRIDGETMETVTDFIFLGSKITANSDCTHEIKRCLLVGRKAMTNLDSILRSRDITLLTKVHLGKVMVLPVVIYGCESWTIQKAEHQRIDTFKLCCWRRLLRVHWTAKRSNQSFLKEINPEYSLEGLMLKLKLQYLGHLMGRIDSLEKAMMLGKIEGERRKGCEVRVVVHFFFFPWRYSASTSFKNKKLYFPLWNILMPLEKINLLYIGLGLLLNSIMSCWCIYQSLLKDYIAMDTL